MNNYLNLTRQGKTSWWRFVFAIILILFFWQVLGAVPSVLLLFWGKGNENIRTGISSSGQIVGVDPIIGFTATMLASVCFLVGIFLAIRLIHLRPFRTLITPDVGIAWKRYFQGFMAWFIFSGLMSLLEGLLHPGRYEWTFNLRLFVPFALVALVLIPIQTSAEELFFRAYFLQAAGLRIRNIWILSSLSGLLFMVPHLLNPEAKLNYLLMGFYYFFIGGVMAYITLRDGGLELALGLHAANNLFSALVANYTVTVLPTPSLFTVNLLDVKYSVAAAVLGLIGFVLIFVGLLKRNVRVSIPSEYNY
jgi:membrane protease YdiL (CAAX protease family)